MDPSNRPHARIPSLDGLRALAVTLVVLQHARLTIPAWVPAARTVVWPFSDGHLGVSIFFVLSGYLITRLLRAEHARTGTISLTAFYRRRAFRILPAYLSFLFVMLLARSVWHLSATNSEFLGAFTFTRNYLPADLRPWWLAHCWSLSVEEQFYLTWPAALYLAGVKRGARLATAIALGGPLIRIASYLLFPHLRGVKGVDTSIDVLMTGCAMALLDGDPGFERLLTRAFSNCLVVSLALFALIACRIVTEFVDTTSRFTMLVGITVENLSIGVLVAWILRHQDSRAARFLNLRPLVFLGTISYSLYLWQQPFLTGDNHTRENTNHSWTGVFPLNIACAVVLACASFFLMERPFLRLRARLERRNQRLATAGSDGPSVESKRPVP